MERQMSLDAWQIRHLEDLLRRASAIVHQTNTPIILYRQTLEEEDGSYEEIVCTLAGGYVVQQRVTSGGVIPPSFNEQQIFDIPEYPGVLIKESRDKFLKVVAILEEELG